MLDIYQKKPFYIRDVEIYIYREREREREREVDTFKGKIP